VIVNKNFLSNKNFNNIKDIFYSTYFPWYLNTIVHNKHYQFTHTFYTQKVGGINSDYFNQLKPLLKKIKYKELLRIKANLITKTYKIVGHGMHTDQSVGKTAIFYINTCNGYTLFKKLNQKIKSEENKFIEFDSNELHTGTSCTDSNFRIVININYI
jgi:hypothetical protein|tara:strand:+ start:215 stop:685 length:471 start_codon:yes stop_codon:yes gene_type:complete